MKKDKKTKKSSVMKKLVPATGMLLVSAIMLTTSTYAWFTMSREVEVQNIKMVATTPEDIQISLGKLAVTGTPATAVTEANSATYSLGGSTGVLYAASGAVAGDNNASIPENAWDWSNIADISAYYDIGRLMPASSYDGTEIYFTPDANGVGKTVKSNANYIKATNALTTVNDSGTGTNANYKATLHALTGERADAAAEGKDAWAKTTYAQATQYNVTNDDGYYVDIPIWLRTSSNDPINLSVDGYVIPGKVADSTNGDLQTQLELYRAVRVAFLDGEDVSSTNASVKCTAGEAAVATANNILPLKDSWSKDGTTLVSATTANTDTTRYMQADLKASNTPFANTNPSVLDSKNLLRTGGKNDANTKLYGVSALGSSATATDGTTYVPGTYTEYTAITPTSATSGWSTVATLEGSTTTAQYGTAKKLIIRVWLDGEDQECWNDNAGQDWAISLKFSKITT